MNYLTGELFDMAAITAAGQRAGAVVGWDLAHAVGNVPLRLHEWGVDWAAWCSYKYLNGGPGAPGGCFVHERHLMSVDLPRLAGWWGNDSATRFAMSPEFEPAGSAEGWQISTPSVLAMAPLRVALEHFDRVGMAELTDRAGRLTGFLLELLEHLPVDVVTPRAPARRGCQLSVRVRGGADAGVLVERLRERHGVVVDHREPGIIRLAPVPLTTSFHDCWRAAEALRDEVSGLTAAAAAAAAGTSSAPPSTVG